jgi:ribosomal protein S6
MKEEGRIYEVGYHILPTVSEEMVPKEVEILKAILAKNNATVISEDAPEEIELAYGIRKVIGGKYQTFTNAYFGSFKFESSPEEMLAIEHAFAKEEKVLRFLVVKTIRENTRLDLEKLFPKEEVAGVEKNEEAETEATKEATAKKAKKAADEEIDKSIESLIK